MTALPWQYSDGGRAAAGYRGFTGDCVVRAIAIAAELDYRDVYGAFHEQMKRNPYLAGRGKASPRAGVPTPLIKWFMNYALCWPWTPTMGIGTGTRVHLAQGELPAGRLVVRVTKHLTAVVDGTILDNHDPARDGTRCVYGYWRRP